MISSERVIEYKNLPSEAPLESDQGEGLYIMYRVASLFTYLNIISAFRFVSRFLDYLLFCFFLTSFGSSKHVELDSSPCFKRQI